MNLKPEVKQAVESSLLFTLILPQALMFEQEGILVKLLCVKTENHQVSGLILAAVAESTC